MASIIGAGAPRLRQNALPSLPGRGRRRRAASRSVAVLASALAGSAVLLLTADPTDFGAGGGGGFFSSFRETLAAKSEGDGAANDGDDGLLTFPMYSTQYQYLDDDRTHRRATVSAGDMGRGATSGSAEPQQQQQLHGGLHFVDLYVGKPAQRRTLAVMTGSDYTAFPCGDCPDCPPSMSQFQPAQSPSFKEIPCGKCLGPGGQCSSDAGNTCVVSETHPDRSSWTGYEARDVALLGAPPSAEGTAAASEKGFSLGFVCQSSARGRFATQVRDGVLGFSPAPTGFISQMSKSGKLKKARFSLCFESWEASARLTMLAQQAYAAALPAAPDLDAGAVTLGGFNPKMIDTPMTYAQSVAADAAPGEDRVGYRVRVTSIYLREGGGPSIRPDHDVGSVRLRRVTFDPDEFNAEGGGMAVDSGALHTVLHASAEESFMEMWSRSTNGGHFSSGKAILTEEEMIGLPTIILQFKSYEGVDTSLDPNTIPNMAGDLDPDNQHDTLMAIPPSSYMEWNPSSGAYRARISFAHDGSGGTVLGSNAMRGHTILYDLEKKRIGFAESRSCQKKKADDDAGGENFDDDMYAVQEETGAGGVHMVEGTLTDDDVFGVPVEAAVKPPPDSPSDGDSAPPAGSAPPADGTPSASAPGNDSAATANDAPLAPTVQMPPPANSNSGNGPSATSQGQPTTLSQDDDGGSDFRKIEGTGSCTTVSCRVWVSVGYFFVGCLLAIVYRTAKNAKLKKEEEEEAERQRLAYEYVKGERPDFGENSVYEKQVWEGPAPSGGKKKEVWEGPPGQGGDRSIGPGGGERSIYGSEVQRDLYDVKEVDEEYDREMPANWR